MRKRVTINDVAEKAGVGRSTVSRVINDSPLVSTYAREKVLKALEETGYEPNLLARGLVSSRTKALALITPPLNACVHGLLEGITLQSKALGYATLLCPDTTWEEQESLSFSWVHKNWLVDGVLVYNLIHHEQVPDDILELQSAGLPFVFINKFLDDPRLNVVGVDNNQSVFLAVEHLAGLGHRRIGTLTGHLTAEDGATRHEAFRAALGRLDLPFDEALARCGEWNIPDGQRAMAELLSLPDPPTAMFCANDHMAQGAIRAAVESGRKVPQDFAVVGFDDHEGATFATPELTTVRPPLIEVGKRAVDLLMQVIEEPERKPEQVRLESELVVRGTTVPGGS